MDSDNTQPTCEKLHGKLTKSFTHLLSNHKNMIEQHLKMGDWQVTIPMSQLTETPKFHVWAQDVLSKGCASGTSIPRTIVSSYTINPWEKGSHIAKSVTFYLDTELLIPDALKTQRVRSQIQDILGPLMIINDTSRRQLKRFNENRSEFSSYSDVLATETELFLKRQKKLFDHCRLNSELTNEECKQLLPYFATL